MKENTGVKESSIRSRDIHTNRGEFGADPTVEHHGAYRQRP